MNASLRYWAAYLKGWLFFQLRQHAPVGCFFTPRMRVEVEHVRNGKVLSRRTYFNIVTTVGKNDNLDKYLKGSAYTAAWFLGLAGTGTKAVGDTLASHAGWAELSGYTGSRPAITWGTTSSGSNTASQVAFAITGTATVAGLFVCSVASGTSGVLFNAVNFTGGDRAVQNGDTLNVTPTLTAS